MSSALQNFSLRADLEPIYFKSVTFSMVTYYIEALDRCTLYIVSLLLMVAKSYVHNFLKVDTAYIDSFHNFSCQHCSDITVTLSRIVVIVIVNMSIMKNLYSTNS